MSDAAYPVPITEAAVQSARRRHEQRLAAEPQAIAVKYYPRRDAISIQMSNGASLIIPRRLLQGLEGATPEQLHGSEIGSDGLELYWPELDAAFTLMSLLAGVYGSKRWMSEFGRKAGSVRSTAKTVAARANGRKGGRPRAAS